MSFYFLTGFFKYFFRVLHEASSSWLKLFRVFQLHPVYRVSSPKIFEVSYPKHQYFKQTLLNELNEDISNSPSLSGTTHFIKSLIITS
jgi:hypothetical protein